MKRHRPASHSARLDALFSCPLIHDIAHDLGPLTHRNRRHPLAMHLAFGAMSRLWHSGNRLDAELASGDSWGWIVERYNKGAALHPFGEEIDTNAPILLADTYRHVRDRLVRDENLEKLQISFTEHSVKLAQQIGLLRKDAGGSRTRPHPTRTIYGDGTVVRPLYGRSESGRQDPDAEEHTRHDGKIYGNDLVAIAVRGAEAH